MSLATEGFSVSMTFMKRSINSGEIMGSWSKTALAVL